MGDLLKIVLMANERASDREGEGAAHTTKNLIGGTTPRTRSRIYIVYIVGVKSIVADCLDSPLLNRTTRLKCDLPASGRPLLEFVSQWWPGLRCQPKLRSFRHPSLGL